MVKKKVYVYMSTSRIIRIASLFNILLCLFFVYSNFSLWQIFRERIVSSAWNPLEITLLFHYHFPDGTYSSLAGISVYANFPFMLFWVSTIVNLCFMLSIYKSKEKPSKELAQKPQEQSAQIPSN